MQNRNILILNKVQVAQITYLPNSFIYDGVKYNLHYQESREYLTALSEIAVRNMNSDIAYDLVIYAGHDVSLNFGNRVSHIDPVTRSFALPRYSKAIQQHILPTYPWVKWFYRLRTSLFSLRLPMPEGTYVLKDQYGSRSVGIITIDTKKLSLEQYSDKINRVINTIHHNSNSETVRAFAEAGISMNAGSVNSDGELTDTLRSFNSNFIIQESSPNIASRIEYRVLIGYGTKPLFYTRPDLDEEFSGYSELVEPNTEMLTEIELYLMAGFPLAMGSVDIWVTDSEWGIYEFQPELSAAHLPGKHHLELYKESLANMVQAMDEAVEEYQSINN